MKKPFVIRVSGISGDGKTAVINALKGCLSNVMTVGFEDYDLVVDGMLSPNEIADEIINAIRLRDYYDALIVDNNDPVHDPKPLKEHMDKWDGELFIEALRLTPEKTVLEIGVGTGRLAARVCDKCKCLTGIDISPKTIERAKKNLHGFYNAHLIHGDFLTHSFTDTFDVIYSSLTFMHMKDKERVIRKIANLLNAHGRFVLSISKNQEMEIDYGTRRIPVYPDTPDEINYFLVKAGLDVERRFETEFAVIFSAVNRSR